MWWLSDADCCARSRFVMWRARPSSGLHALLLGIFLLGSAPTPTAAIDIHEQVVTRAQWPQHANGLNVLALPAVHQTLRRFEETDQVTIVIRYPGGDPGVRWARALHGWLVSFGVPTRYLELEPGSGAVDQLVVSVIDRR